MYYAIISTEIIQKAAIGANGSAFYDARKIINFWINGRIKSWAKY